MLINLTDVFTSEGKVKNISVPYEQKSFHYMGSDLPIAGKPDISLTLTNIGTGSVLVEGSIEIVLIIPCDRCLASVDVPLSVTFAQQVLSPEKVDNASGETSDDISFDDGQDFMSGYELDTDALINNEILINMPVKVLCADDCKGICPVCGHNLNEGDCGCDRFVPDPRMAAIKDIFNANKEV